MAGAEVTFAAEEAVNRSAAHGAALPHMQNYFYAAFRRAVVAPKVVPTWRLPTTRANTAAGPIRYLVDIAPGGRMNVIKLAYGSDGKPSWLVAAGGLSTTTSAAASLSVATGWHRLTLSSSSKQVGFCAAGQRLGSKVNALTRCRAWAESLRRCQPTPTHAHMHCTHAGAIHH